MKASITTFGIGVGILLALIALTFGIWFYPGISLLALVLVPLGACLSEKKSDKLVTSSWMWINSKCDFPTNASWRRRT